MSSSPKSIEAGRKASNPIDRSAGWRYFVREKPEREGSTRSYRLYGARGDDEFEVGYFLMKGLAEFLGGAMTSLDGEGLGLPFLAGMAPTERASGELTYGPWTISRDRGRSGSEWIVS